MISLTTVLIIALFFMAGITAQADEYNETIARIRKEQDKND